VTPIAVVIAAAMTASASVEAGLSRPASLHGYFSSMSWPVRASALRAYSASSAIEGWVTVGDPPFLGGIAARCLNLLAVESRGRLLQIDAPPGLRVGHGRLVRAYSQARSGCWEARFHALAVRAASNRFYRSRSAADRRAWDRAASVARRELRLHQTTLRSFVRAVFAWRLAALAEAKAAGLPAPVWLTALRL
jgi:hypothetical protein